MVFYGGEPLSDRGDAEGGVGDTHNSISFKILTFAVTAESTVAVPIMLLTQEVRLGVYHECQLSWVTPSMASAMAAITRTP